MTFINRPRLLYYCQSLVGIGHLTASLRIIAKLLPTVDVDLVYGGIAYQHYPKHLGFRVLELPPLLFNAQGELYTSLADTTVEQVWQQRQTHIQHFLTPPYQGIVLEFYPFGRRRFKQEIRSLCQQAKQISGNIPVFCQVRDILVPTSLTEEEAVLNLINREIDMVLVRADSQIVTLDATFSLASSLGERLFYGGYVTEPPPTYWPERLPQILVSQGGGNVGQQLLTAAINTAVLLPDYYFLITTGSSAFEQDINALQASAKSPNVTVMRFLPDFRQQLLKSSLSINMGGDNTLLDMIATKTPCLAYPYPGNAEQAIRINTLAKQGFVTALSDADLEPSALKAHILASLDKPYPQTTINLDGALNIAHKICTVMQVRP